jgi:ribose transport system substrate-binding protein
MISIRSRSIFFGLIFAFSVGGGTLAPRNARSATAAEGLVHAEAVIAKHRARPVFTPPGAAFDARKCAASKKMLSIPNTSANPFLKGIIQREIAAGKEVGLTVQEWQNEGQPSQWVQGLEYARRNGFHIVNLISGIDPKSIEPQIKAAAAAGVKTMTSHFYDPSQPQNPLVAASLPVNFNYVGKLLADWAIVRTRGKANIVLVVSNEVPPTGPLVRGLRDELKQYCPGCRIVQEINVGVTEWGTKIRPSVQSALLAHPSVNFIIPIYESMAQSVEGAQPVFRHVPAPTGAELQELVQQIAERPHRARHGERLAGHAG